MTILGAYAVTVRLVLIVLAAAMCVAYWRPCWAVIVQKPGWQASLSTFVFTLMTLAGAIISSVNLFPDAGWDIDRELRLFVVCLGLTIFVVGVLTGLYRRACRAGPDAARRTLFGGLALIFPCLGFVLLLTIGGANG